MAVVIFSGLISSALLDTFLTPAMFWLFGRKPAQRVMQSSNVEALGNSGGQAVHGTLHAEIEPGTGGPSGSVE
jgi:hypothetical protein